MARKRLRRIFISTPSQWRAVMSPIRTLMLDSMAFLAPCSLSELAAQIGRAPDGLYHHAKILHKAGLIRPVSKRYAGRTKEVVVDLVADGYNFPTTRATASERKKIRRLDRMDERTITSTFADAMDAGLLKSEPNQNFTQKLDFSWLTSKDISEILKLYRAARKILDKSQRRPRVGKLYMFTQTFCPVRPKPQSTNRGEATRKLSRKKQS